MHDNPKAWWTLLFIQCTMVAIVLGAYFGMKTNILTMKNELRLMNVRVRFLEERLAATTASSTGPNSARSAGGTPNADGQDNGEKAPSPEGSSRQSPVCVNKMTHLVIPCGLASKCLGGNNFDAEYFKKIRQKIGLADSEVMMICDEKSNDDSVPSAEPHGTHTNSAPSATAGSSAPEPNSPPSGTSQQYGL